MATRLFTNNARSTLAAPITDTATSLTLSTGGGALFASPTGGDWQDVTLDDGVHIEICRMMGRTGDALTVVRAQEGTAAYAFAAGAVLAARWTAGAASAAVGGGSNPTESLIIAVSDETTALTTGTAKVTFRMPYAFTLAAVRASLSTAQASGAIFTVDINEAGASILSTKLTLDNTEKTSVTAATPAVISDAALADDAEITLDIDQVGDGTAKGLKVVLIGARP